MDFESFFSFIDSMEIQKEDFSVSGFADDGFHISKPQKTIKNWIVFNDFLWFYI